MGGQDHTTGSASDNPFWDFSLVVYDRAGVAAACLALQNRHGVDVNVLLFCAWAGSCGHPLGPGDLAKLRTAAHPWQSAVVAPLRAVRRQLKAMEGTPESAIGRLRSRIKGAELDAEAVEQRLLFEGLAIAAGAGVPSLSGANMIAYLAAMNVAVDAADVADLATVLRGCYPDLPPLQAVWAVTG
jgi:uncharacterized protein (TIGR02444 family)